MAIPKAHENTAEFIDDYLQAGLAGRAIETLDELCAIHGISKEEVYRVLYLKGDDGNDGPAVTLNTKDTELFRAIIHPTFLDLPSDFKGWRQLQSYNHRYRYGETREDGAVNEGSDADDPFDYRGDSSAATASGAMFNVPAEPVPGIERRMRHVETAEMGPEHSAYLFYCMPPFQRRTILGFLLNDLGEDRSVDIFDSKKMPDDELRGHLRLAIIKFQNWIRGLGEITQPPEAQPCYTMVELIRRNPIYFMERSHYKIAESVARDAAQLDRNLIKRTVTLTQDDIEDSIALTQSMNAWLEGQGSTQRLHPRQICDTLFAYNAPDNQDPLLIMNIRRFLDQDTTDNEAHKAIREHFATMDAQGFRYDQPALIENLAQQFSSAPLYILALEQLAKHTGISEDDLFNFVSEPKKSWVPDNGQWKVNPLSTFGKLIAAAKIQDPATLLAPPSEAAPVKAKPVAVVTKSDAPVAKVVRNEWEQAGYPKGLGEQLKGRVNTPKELDGVIDAALALMPEKMRNDASRKLFKAALQNPVYSSGLADVPTYPSLPHVWLMWAMRPETQALGREQTAYELAKTFGADDEAAREASAFTRTAPGAFAAWVIEQVRDARGKQAFTSYGDYLRSVDGKEDRTGQLFEQNLAYLARVDGLEALQPKDNEHAARMVRITGITSVTLTGILGPIRRGDRVVRAIKKPMAAATK